jgi:DNA mismatch repair protein MutS
MAQFQRVKKQFPDHLLLFQVGDFYELYGEDASTAASKTSLRLTKKAGVLMAGFPVRSLDEWQRILVEAGLQLAICNQQPLKKDQTSPSLLEREVVRLVTPGTLTEPLDQGANYLLCIAPGPTSELGLAWADVSTAEFKVSSVGVASLDEDLERLTPSEVLLPKAVAESVQDKLRIGLSNSLMMDGLLQSSHLRECHLTPVPATWYNEEEIEPTQEHRYIMCYISIHQLLPHN